MLALYTVNKIIIIIIMSFTMCHIAQNAFSDINISQGSVTTHLRCGGIFNDRCIANFLEIVTVKEFLKPANIWRSYVCVEHLGFTFLAHPVHISEHDINRPVSATF